MRSVISKADMALVHRYLEEGKQLPEISDLTGIVLSTLTMRLRKPVEQAARRAISLPGEVWRPMVGLESTYVISSLGRVKRLAGEQSQSFASGREEVCLKERIISSRKIAKWVRVINLRVPVAGSSDLTRVKQFALGLLAVLLMLWQGLPWGRSMPEGGRCRSA